MYFPKPATRMSECLSCLKLRSDETAAARFSRLHTSHINRSFQALRCDMRCDVRCDVRCDACRSRESNAKGAEPPASKSAQRKKNRRAVKAAALSPWMARSIPARWVQFMDKDTPTVPLWKRKPRARQGSYGFEEVEDDG